LSAVLVQLSDPHVVAGPAGDAAAAALAQVVAAVTALPVPPAAVLVSGDLAHDGLPESYARVRELLEPLPCPVHVIPGNHDDPAALAEAFPGDDEAMVGELRLLLVDTHLPGSDAGRLDLGALEARLDDRPTLIAMHHPPLRTGIKAIDDLGLTQADRDGLEALLARSPQVELVLCGHVHRITFETLAGVGVFTAPATWLQAEPAGGSIAWVERGRGYAIHTYLDGALVTQIQPV
jgi:3',5'-cyclic AMP phosphodiesterase CpdA